MTSPEAVVIGPGLRLAPEALPRLLGHISVSDGGGSDGGGLGGCCVCVCVVCGMVRMTIMCEYTCMIMMMMVL